MLCRSSGPTSAWWSITPTGQPVRTAAASRWPRSGSSALRHGRRPASSRAGRRECPCGRLCSERGSGEAREQLIDARQYVRRSRWQDVQPRAREQNAFLKTHSWEEYATRHLGLTEDAAEETKARDRRRCGRGGLVRGRVRRERDGRRPERSHARKLWPAQAESAIWPGRLQRAYRLRAAPHSEGDAVWRRRIWQVRSPSSRVAFGGSALRSARG